MAYYASISRKAPTCPGTASTTSTPSPPPSMAGPERPSDGAPQPKPSTSYYSQSHKPVLRRLVEPKQVTDQVLPQPGAGWGSQGVPAEVGTRRPGHPGAVCGRWT